MPQVPETTNIESTPVTVTPVVEKAPRAHKPAAKKAPKAEPKAKAPAKKKAAPKAKAKPAKAKQGLPRGVQRVTAALASLRRSATAEEISNVMGVGRAAVLSLLGASTSEDPATAIGARLVEAIQAGIDGPDSAERVLRYRLTAEGKGMAEQAAKKAGSAKNAAKRPTSQIQAAIEVLRGADEEGMNPAEIMAAVEKKGLWECPNGKTPVATLSAAMGRDAAGEKPRFRKVSRGHFVLTALGAKS